VEENGDGLSRRFSKWITSARRYQQRVEQRRWVAFLVESVRRFNRIEGKHLALVITVNIFVAIIPLIIVGDAGRAFREEVEVRTDELERAVLDALGDDLENSWSTSTPGPTPSSPPAPIRSGSRVSTTSAADPTSAPG
jgi:hypothetical protein